MLFLDLDGTVWDHPNISSLEPPFTRVSDNTIVDSTGIAVHLHQNVRRFLSEIRELGIKVIALSWNVYEIAYQALQAFDLVKYFDALYIEPHPHKGYLMAKALQELNLDVKPCEVLYIDDRDIHIDEIKAIVGNVVFIQAWKHFKSFNELLNLVKKLCS